MYIFNGLTDVVRKLAHDSTPLHNAAYDGDLVLVKKIFDENKESADRYLNYRNNHDRTPVDDAIDRLKFYQSKNDPQKIEMYEQIISFLRLKGGLTAEEIKEKLPVIPDSFKGDSISRNELIFCEPPDDKIGEGASSIVYKGHFRDQQVAIKKLKPGFIVDEEFTSEIKIMASLTFSPYVVRYYGACLTPPDYCLVMEYANNGSLFIYLNSSNVMSWDVRYRIAVDIGYGMQYIHERGIVHGDLKSLNVLLDKELRARVSDFGLSKIKPGVITFDGKSSGGTIRWMAPEVLSPGAKNTKESDVYSFGMVLWELGARTSPFSGKSNDRVVDIVKNGGRETVTNDTPKKMAELIGRCWKERTERPKIDEAVKELKEEQLANFKH